MKLMFMISDLALAAPTTGNTKYIKVASEDHGITNGLLKFLLDEERNSRPVILHFYA